MRRLNPSGLFFVFFTVLCLVGILISQKPKMQSVPFLAQPNVVNEHISFDKNNQTTGNNDAPTGDINSSVE